MTVPGSGRSRPGGGASTRPLDDHLMRIVVATMNIAVDRLSRAAMARRWDSPASAAHIQKLSQVVAGVTLDALRTWPATRE